MSAATPLALSSACRWERDDVDGYWATACHHAFEFTDGGPLENDFRFCPYCGRVLTTGARSPKGDARDDAGADQPSNCDTLANDGNMAGAHELVRAILMNQPIWPNDWGQDVAAAAFFLTDRGSRSAAVATITPPGDKAPEP